MTNTATAAPDYGPAGEAKLRAFVEGLTGGTVKRMERLVRWRPAWRVDVVVADASADAGAERGEKTLCLHLRGDRGGDVSIFPELQREADVIEVLGANGINVPHIYGVCQDPPCILMAAISGSRDMSTAASDAERAALAREYISEVAAMHRLPVAGFVAKGVQLPQGAQEIALAGLTAYLPLYQRTKSRPEPMLEFVLGWIRRNVPQHRTRAAFIQFDSGQFLHQNGKISGLYDFEFSMIGDPMVDLATMRMRESIEPLCADFQLLCKHYEEFSGEPVDIGVVDFHTLLFATISTMQFTGTVGKPRPGDAHSVYLEFDLALRQVVLLTLSKLMGVKLVAEPAPHARVGDNASVLTQLADTVARIETTSPTEQTRQDSAAQLIEWLVRGDAFGPEMRARDLADVEALLGQRFDEWSDASAALEAHVMAVGPQHDAALLHLFAAIEGRRLLIYGPTRIGHSAMHVNQPTS